MSDELLIMVDLKVCFIFALHNTRYFSKDNPNLTLKFFFEMAKSVLWRDEEIAANLAFHVMARSEILDMAGRKTRKTHVIAKHYAFHANTITHKHEA